MMWVQNSVGKYYQETNTRTDSLKGKGFPSNYLLGAEIEEEKLYQLPMSDLLWIFLVPTRQVNVCVFCRRLHSVSRMSLLE